MKRKYLIEIISGLLILLFVYAAVTKLMEYNRFHLSVEKEPLIGSFANFITWLVPAIELFISYLLFRPETRKLGLKAAFSLMSVFTLYVAYILLFVPIRPCGCGGVIQKLSWPQHLVFNIFFTVIALLGIILFDKPALRSYKHIVKPQ